MSPMYSICLSIAPVWINAYRIAYTSVPVAVDKRSKHQLSDQLNWVSIMKVMLSTSVDQYAKRTDEAQLIRVG